jgi:hypothetical protein
MRSSAPSQPLKRSCGPMKLPLNSIQLLLPLRVNLSSS